MFRRFTLLLSAAALVALPAGAGAAETSSSTPKAQGLLRAAANFDRQAARLTAKADALQVTSGTLRVEAAATDPVDADKVDQADRLDARATKLDAAAARFTARAAAFRTKAATRLAKVDDEPAAAAEAKKAKGLLNAAARLRANAARKAEAAATLRTDAAAADPVDQAKLDQAARLDRVAAKLTANALRLEARAAAHAAKAEAKAAAAA